MNETVDLNFVFEITPDELKYFNVIDNKYGISPDELIHCCLNWCFHSRYFWEQAKAHKLLSS